MGGQLTDSKAQSRHLEDITAGPPSEGNIETARPPGGAVVVIAVAVIDQRVMLQPVGRVPRNSRRKLPKTLLTFAGIRRY